MTEPIVSRHEMASLLGVSPATFDRMRREAREAGSPIPEMTYGRRLVRFLPSRVFARLGIDDWPTDR